MANALHKLAGIECAEGAAPTPADWLRSWGPFVAPLAIIASGAATGSLASVALVWIVLLVPGVLAVNMWFPRTHPLGRGASRLGVASVLALFPFGIFSYAGSVLHWRLTTVMMLYGVVYVAAVALLAYALLRREPSAPAETAPESLELPWAAPRWVAVVVLVAIGVVMVGVTMSAPNTHIKDIEFTKINLYERPDWWHGAVIGAVAAIVAAAVLVIGQVRAKRSNDAAAGNAPPTSTITGRSKGKGRLQKKSQRDRTARGASFDWGRALVALLWIACGVFTWQFMRVTYSESYSKPEQIGQGALVWNVDDVAYVSEAVDYRYGHPLGKFDPSVGGQFAMPRGRMSPLFAPLVAAIARVTGVGCAALHHSVMPPLVILVGASCFSAVLMVVFRGHRWAVPLALLVALMLVFKTWDYARCVVEMLIYRAMQPKSVHLWWLHPLQFASVVLLARQASTRHLLFAAVVAFVGHLVHPFATIMGMVICTTMTLVTLVERRGAFIRTAALLAVYCAFGGEYYAATRVQADVPSLSSGRKPGDALQSRDLVRADQFVFSLGTEFATDLESGAVTRALAQAFRDKSIGIPVGFAIERSETAGYYYFGQDRQGSYRLYVENPKIDVYRIAGEPRPRHDPIWTFGCNTLYLAGSLAVPIVLALGLRRRELLYIGLLGATVLISTNFEPVGRLLNVPLPIAIFWRARWMLPALVNLGAMAVAIYWAVGVLLRTRDNRVDAARSLIACVVAVAAFGMMLAGTDSRRVEVGKAPAQLSKFSAEMHELVEKLGGVEARPFVWGTFLIHHELPQLMPNINLVFSRTKFMRRADTPDYRALVEGVFNGYRKNEVNAQAYDRLLVLFPIDHMVVDRGYRASAKKLIAYLEERGWRRVGRTTRRYEVWRHDERAAARNAQRESEGFPVEIDS